MSLNQAKNGFDDLALPSKVMVVGGGGREHALVWKLGQSGHVKEIYCAPGNGGTASSAKCKNLPIAVDDFEAIALACTRHDIEFVIVGPDNPLALGIVDFLNSKQIACFGPTKEQAKLEWSKAYAKNFMERAGLATAKFAIADSYDQALSIVRENSWAKVIKADGLALGKGVFVCDDLPQAEKALCEIFVEEKFGEAGSLVVIEEKLEGEELSLLVLCDGKTLYPLPATQDHKRRFDGDKGPNTGGMGAYSSPSLYEQYRSSIEEFVLSPLQKALDSKLLNFNGVLFIGLMMTPNKGRFIPNVLEFNARFGDPETQTLMPLLESDLLELVWACAQGKLDTVQPEWSSRYSCCVIAAHQGYPDSSSKDREITIGKLPDQVVAFQAGTKQDGAKLLSNGGRVLCLTATATSLKQAVSTAYQGIGCVQFEQMDYRKDIAGRALNECLSI